jgi:MarR family
VGGEREERWGRREREIIERGMSPEIVHLLALSEMEGWSATPGELASHMSRNRSEVRRMLNRLLRAGWVRKQRGDTYAIARERWPEAEADLRHLRALREQAGERDASRKKGRALEGWLYPLPWLTETACGCEGPCALLLACWFCACGWC